MYNATFLLWLGPTGFNSSLYGVQRPFLNVRLTCTEREPEKGGCRAPRNLNHSLPTPLPPPPSPSLSLNSQQQL